MTPWDFADLSGRSLAAQAVFAEGLGFESFWLPENHFNPGAVPDPLMLLASVAASTNSLKLATTSYLLTLRHPLQAAEQVAVLDQLSEGRVILGVGRGFAADMLRAFDVNPREKRTVFERAYDTMQRAWRGDAIDVGDGVTVQLDPLPVQQPAPPVWVAAFGPKALAQSGRLALPYLASPMETLETLERNYALARQASAAAGVEPAPEVPIMRSVFVSRDTALLRRVCDQLEQRRPERASQDAPLTDWLLVGEPAAVAEQLAAYKNQLGITHLVATRLRLPGLPESALKASLESLAELVQG